MYGGRILATGNDQVILFYSKPSLLLLNYPTIHAASFQYFFVVHTARLLHLCRLTDIVLAAIRYSYAFIYF